MKVLDGEEQKELPYPDTGASEIQNITTHLPLSWLCTADLKELSQVCAPRSDVLDPQSGSL